MSTASNASSSQNNEPGAEKRKWVITFALAPGLTESYTVHDEPVIAHGVCGFVVDGQPHYVSGNFHVLSSQPINSGAANETALDALELPGTELSWRKISQEEYDALTRRGMGRCEQHYWAIMFPEAAKAERRVSESGLMTPVSKSGLLERYDVSRKPEFSNGSWHFVADGEHHYVSGNAHLRRYQVTTWYA